MLVNLLIKRGCMTTTIYWLSVVSKSKEVKRIGTFNYRDLIKLGKQEKLSNNSVHYSREVVNL